MARPQKNTVDYFPLYCKEGKSMYYIENKYGNNGYATWIKILSQLATSENHYLNLSDKIQFMYLSAKCKVSDIELESIINDLSLLGEFDNELWTENKIIFSEKFILSIKDAYEKRNNDIICRNSLLQLLDSLGVRKLSKSSSKPIKLPIKGDGKPQTILDYNKEDNNNKDFELFWNTYNKKIGNKKKAEKIFNKLSKVEIEKIFETLPLFLSQITDKKFQPHAETYLNNQRWNDEIAVEEIKQTYIRHDKASNGMVY